MHILFSLKIPFISNAHMRKNKRPPSPPHHHHVRGLQFPVTEDVVTDILVRIPANQLLKFQRVCKRWKNLISTPYFKDKYLVISKERNFSIILTQSDKNIWNDDLNNRFIIIDNWGLRRGSQPIFLEGPINFKDGKRNIAFSHDGLIVMGKPWMGSGHIIYNPVTKETVKIDVSKSGYKSSIYSFFFNPWIKEYCVILISGKRQHFKFKILNLGSKPCRRPLKIPESYDYSRYLFSFFYHPVVIKDANIYWFLTYMSCEELILAFDIKREEFSFLPHPCPHSFESCKDGYQEHINMHIINIHGCLSFVQNEVSSNVVIFNIWTLKDSTSTDWIKIHSIIVNACEFNIPVYEVPCMITNLETNFHVIAFQDGEMLFEVPNKRRSVFAYNLESQTLRKMWESEGSLSGLLGYFHYTPSFASLKN